MSEKNIKKYMEYNFGQMQWDMADKTVFSKKTNLSRQNYFGRRRAL